MILNEGTIESIAGAMAATTILGSAAAAPKYLRLFKNDIEPDPTTLIGDITDADFDGYADVAVEEAIATIGIDALTGNRRVVVLQAAGGSVFQVSGGVTNLPQTIYGWALLNNAKTAIVGIERFETPIVLANIDDMLTIDNVSVGFEDIAFA